MSPRVAMFVLNPVRYDRRVIREAAALAGVGCQVTVYGVADDHDGTLSRERHGEGFDIVRVPMPGQSSLWRRGAPGAAGQSAGVGAGVTNSGKEKSDVSAPRRRWSPSQMLGGVQARWLLNARRRWWGWGQAVLKATEEADVFHGHDLPGLGVAVYARARHGGLVVYDSHDLFLEAGANATRPRPVRQLMRTIERRWYRQADLLVTVNGALAARLADAYGPKPTAVVHNCVPTWDPESVSEDPLRAAAGVPAGTPVVLYHGGFTSNRGLGLLMRAMLEPGLECCHLVLLGYGPMGDELERLAQQEHYAGRVHVLAPVPPEVLDRYVACADVAAMVNQPSSANELLSTPNKLFESIAAGVPIVTSDFPMRREIVMGGQFGPLGAVCDPTQPATIAAALRQVLNAPPVIREELRRSCRRAARERWNWERESMALVDAYQQLLGATVPAAQASWTDRPV